MRYKLLHSVFSEEYLQKPDQLLMDKNIKYQVFLRVVANYALTLNMGFDTLFLVKNTECSIHLLKMLLDTSVRTYGLLLATNPDKYMNEYLQDCLKDDFASTNINKVDNTPLLDSNIIEYMESDGYSIKELYIRIGKYLHPSSNYCYGKKANNELMKCFDLKREKKAKGETRSRTPRVCESLRWILTTMTLVNQILLETMDKIVEMLEPKPTTQFVFQDGKFVPYSIYKYYKEK